MRLRAGPAVVRDLSRAHARERAPRWCLVRDVLLVEDSPTLRFVLTEALERRGCRVHAIEQASEVLAAARRLLPAVVILNKMLSGRDGYAVMKELRADPVTRDVKVMMLTESKSRQDVMRGIQGGADDYVVKPFDPNDVAVRVERLVRLAHSG